MKTKEFETALSEELVLLYRKNNNQIAFTELYNRFNNMRKNLIFKNDQKLYSIDLEIVFEDCFIRAVKNFDETKSKSFSSYLYYCLVNRLRTAIKKHIQYDELYADNGVLNRELDENDFINNSIIDHSENVEDKLNTIILHELIESHKKFYLSKKKNKKLILSIIDENIFGNKSVKEIASENNCSCNNASFEKNAYKRSLRMYLNKNYSVRKE